METRLSGQPVAASPTCLAALPITWYPPSWRGHYPQLSQEDRLIWNRFLDRHAHQFDGYAYDVSVGGIDCDDDTVTDAMRKSWRYCTSKRIDVLAIRSGLPTIIECRYQAGVSAVGALMVYRVLFHEHNPDLPAPPLVLVTDSIAPDTRRAAEYYGITVVVLPS